MFVLRYRPERGLLCLAALLLLGSAAVRADEPELEPDYRPGQGWQVPGTGISLGGYASAGFENLRDSPASYAVNDLSLFVHWEGEGKFRFFSEIDLEDAFSYSPASGSDTGDRSVALERLYGDYLYSAGLNFRAGKFLTPIGRWNIVHADPLVWTTSRPLTTERLFPTNVTGAMVFGSVSVLGRDLDYSVYTALANDWRPDPKLDPFDEAYGLHIETPVSANAEFGVSLVSFEQKSSVGERKKLLGLDYFWSRGRYELAAEAAYRISDEGNMHDERGLFIQGVAPLSARLYAVARYEFYDEAGPTPAVNLWLAGLALKLSPALVLKIEYREASELQVLAPDGLLASISVLF